MEVKTIMRIEKEVRLPNVDACFLAAYTQDVYTQRDSAVTIYDKYKISIMLTDGLAVVVNDAVIDTGKNSILFFRPDEIHFGRFFRSGLHAYLDFYIPIAFLENLMGNTDKSLFFSDTLKDRINYIVFDASGQRNLSEIAEKTIRALENQCTMSDLEIYSLMLQVVLLCANSYDIQKMHPIQNKVPEFVTKTLLYISENYGQKISLEYLAAKAGCSVTYLARSFKQYTGKTIYNHIIDTRIGNAQRLLKQGLTVTEVCYATGFDDCSNFIRTFKNMTGKTPLQFKNSFLKREAEKVF